MTTSGELAGRAEEALDAALRALAQPHGEALTTLMNMYAELYLDLTAEERERWPDARATVFIEFMDNDRARELVRAYYERHGTRFKE